MRTANIAPIAAAALIAIGLVLAIDGFYRAVATGLYWGPYVNCEGGITCENPARQSFYGQLVSEFWAGIIQLCVGLGLVIVSSFWVFKMTKGLRTWTPVA